jgi:hypothetical protein
MAAVAVDGDRDGGGGGGSGDDENNEKVKKTAEMIANWEVEWIMGTDGEGTISDDDGTGAEVTAECF